jgi:hypothetical protein
LESAFAAYAAPRYAAGMDHSGYLPPFLTDAEIAEICTPLIAPSTQIRYLARLGLIVNRKPNGKPLVARGEFERGSRSIAPVAIGTEPDLAGLHAWAAKRKLRKPKAG